MADVKASRRSLPETVALLGAVLHDRSGEIGADIRETITTSIPELRGDDRVINALAASVEANVVTLLHVLQGAASMEDAEAPPAAVGYARQLAQHGVSQVALIRAYRVGHARFLRWCFREIEARLTPGELPEATAAVVETSFEYIDRVSEHVVRAYEAERDRWSRNRGAVRRARVRALLAGEPVDVSATEHVLGYRLHQLHVGVVVWCRRRSDGRNLLSLEHAVAGAAESMRARSAAPLFIPYDDTSAWAWLAGPSEAVPESLGYALDMLDPPVQLALGEPAMGIAGFRQSHQEALRAQSVALAGGEHSPSVTWFHEVAPVAALSTDLDFTRVWVRATLGKLADPGAAHARLRETARAFLTSGSSYTAAAELLHIHKNTVQYRIQKAEELLGRPLREGRMEVELALLACRWMGDALTLDENEVPPRPSRANVLL